MDLSYLNHTVSQDSWGMSCKISTRLQRACTRGTRYGSRMHDLSTMRVALISLCNLDWTWRDHYNKVPSAPYGPSKYRPFEKIPPSAAGATRNPISKEANLSRDLSIGDGYRGLSSSGSTNTRLRWMMSCLCELILHVRLNGGL